MTQPIPANEPETGALPLRILCVHNNADLYGASRMLLRWTKHLDTKRFKVIVALPEDGPLKESFEAAGIEVVIHRKLSVIARPVFRSWRIFLFFLNYPLSVAYLWQMIRTRRIDVVYSNTGVVVSPALAAFLARVPHLWRIQECFDEFRRFWPVLSIYMKWFSCRILACSKAIAAQFKPPGAAMVLYDGFAMDEFQVPKGRMREEVRARYGLGDAFVVGCVGRIKFVRKGQEFLVQAASLLKQRGVRFKALIVGAPFPGNEEHLERLQVMVRELGVEEYIVFTGELRDARPTYAAMDVVALTSAQPEPFGGVVMEGMAMGLPVIATNIGGSLDQVVDGVTGMLIPPADPVALADAIEKLMRDPALCARMGAAGLDRIQSKFTLTEMTRKVEELLEASIQRRALDSSIIGNGKGLGDEAIAARKPITILHVQSNADLYGSSRSLLRLIKAMDRQRFKSLVILPEHGPLKQWIEAQDVEVIVFPRLSVITRRAFHSWRIVLFFLNYPLSVAYLTRLIRRRGVRLVHSNTGVVVSAAMAARLAGVPHVWHIRDSFHEFRTLWSAYSAYIQRLSYKVIAVSNAMADQFSPRRNVVVIHNGFALDDYRVPKEALRVEVRARYGIKDEFVVGCVGRIKLVRKGQEVLIQAAALLKQRGKVLKALIVGAPLAGNEKHLAQLHQMAKDLAVEDCIIFTGEIPDPRPAYAAMDVLAMTSVQPEPFGGVVMEAMSMGLPVIATNVGGSLDQVVEGVTGLFVPPGDAAALADAIEKLMENRELCQRMGTAGTSRIQNEFSLVEMTHKMEKLFDDAMSADVIKNG